MTDLTPERKHWDVADYIAALDAERARNRNLEAVAEAAETLVSACEEEFTSEETETGEFRYPDGEEVAGPSSHITFGMIRALRAALAVLEEPPELLYCEVCDSWHPAQAKGAT